MAKNRIFDICYKDPDNDKDKWHQIGVLLEDEQGKLKIKINFIPTKLSAWWSVFPRKEKG